MVVVTLSASGMTEARHRISWALGDGWGVMAGRSLSGGFNTGSSWARWWRLPPHRHGPVLGAECVRQPQLTATCNGMRQRQVILPANDHHFAGNTLPVDL
jgi:hypothetical protein